MRKERYKRKNLRKECIRQGRNLGEKFEKGNSPSQG